MLKQVLFHFIDGKARLREADLPRVSELVSAHERFPMLGFPTVPALQGSRAAG